jgi:hypothetical protein
MRVFSVVLSAFSFTALLWCQVSSAPSGVNKVAQSVDWATRVSHKKDPMRESDLRLCLQNSEKKAIAEWKCEMFFWQVRLHRAGFLNIKQVLDAFDDVYFSLWEYYLLTSEGDYNEASEKAMFFTQKTFEFDKLIKKQVSVLKLVQEQRDWNVSKDKYLVPVYIEAQRIVVKKTGKTDLIETWPTINI